MLPGHTVLDVNGITCVACLNKDMILVVCRNCQSLNDGIELFGIIGAGCFYIIQDISEVQVFLLDFFPYSPCIRPAGRANGHFSMEMGVFFIEEKKEGPVKFQPLFCCDAN